MNVERSREVAICRNDPSHDKFIASAHVVQTWVVDRDGEFIEVSEDCTDVTHGPSTDNQWTCSICGGEVDFDEVDS